MLKDIQIPHEMTHIPYEITPHISSETKTWHIGSVDTGVKVAYYINPRDNVTSVPMDGEIGDMFFLNNRFYIWDESNLIFKVIGVFRAEPTLFNFNGTSGYIEVSYDNGVT
jgi:hypothetical protein